MKVLFLSVPTGQGHNQVAYALENYMTKQKNVECKTLDVFDNVNPFLGDSLQRSYLLSTKVTPKVYGRFYDLADRRDSSKDSALGKFLKTLLNKKLLSSLREFSPDIIVATHAFSAIALTYLKRKYPIKAKTIAVVTDFTVHPFWEDTSLDYYVTASELLNYQMAQKGIPTNKIRAFGIPIDAKFSEKTEKSAARAHFSLKDKFTILVMMGSMGYGNHTFATLRQLDRMNEDFQIAVVCGNNHKLKQHIDRCAWHKEVLSFGFTKEVSLLMDASDCIITKPGGLSSSESLAKGLPIIMLDPIPGQEDRNKEFMLNNGIALSISDTLGINEIIYNLIMHPYKLEMLRQNMSYVAKPDSTRELSEFIMNLSKE